MLGVIESVALVLELAIVLISLSYLFGKRIKMDIYVIALVVIYLFIFLEINSGELPTYVALLTYVAIFVYSLFRYKKSIIVTLINCILAFAIVSLLQLIFCIPIYYLYDREAGMAGLNSLLVNAISVGVIILVGKKVKLKQISDFIQHSRWILKVSLIFITLYLFVNIFYMQMHKTIDSLDYIQMIVFMALFFLAVNEWQKAIVDAERKKTQLEMNRLYYDAYDELLLLIRERQHDMKNHINAILGMIYTIDNYEDLVESQRKYCDDIVEKNKETKLLLSISNPLIAGFLYRKFQEAQKQKILIESTVA